MFLDLFKLPFSEWTPTHVPGILSTEYICHARYVPGIKWAF